MIGGAPKTIYEMRAEYCDKVVREILPSMLRSRGPGQTYADVCHAAATIANSMWTARREAQRGEAYRIS